MNRYNKHRMNDYTLDLDLAPNILAQPPLIDLPVLGINDFRFSIALRRPAYHDAT